MQKHDQRQTEVTTMRRVHWDASTRSQERVSAVSHVSFYHKSTSQREITQKTSRLANIDSNAHNGRQKIFGIDWHDKFEHAVY